MKTITRSFLTGALLCFGIGNAHALFADDEARKGVADLRARLQAQEQTLKQLQSQMPEGRALLNLADQIDALKQEMANLRGQVEMLSNQVDQLEKRQKDLYVDLDTRLRKFEQVETEKQSAAQAAANEQQAYEAGLAQFKANNYGAAVQTLQSFLSTYPQSPLAPSAQYWIGNAHYALRDYKASITAQEKVVANWPESAKAPDALLNIASSQAELGNAAASRKTLQNLVATYPKSQAAEQAKQRLKK
ncbi:MAG TPA: tol-pal system protein YbgF [Burkholderiales bacterium]|nr:tol-pal system protein YbgF [Burkholderiales bacterium]